MSNPWRRAHRRALKNGESSYIDPQTGFHVFTEIGLRRRGQCCGSGCRHCPYQHEAMSLEDRAARGKQPSWLTADAAPDALVDVLFWSGGKDSFLALRALGREGPSGRKGPLGREGPSGRKGPLRPVVLLTTFDVATRTVAHQEIPIDAVIRQAEHLGLPLLGVPLHAGEAYMDRIRAGCELVPQITRLVFGDLHLLHIREWRSVAFREFAADRGAALHFPLWGVPYDTLIADLEASGVACEVSAVTEAAQGVVAVGERFDRAMMARLPRSVDPFGENGEFHTLAKVWEKAWPPGAGPDTGAGASRGAQCRGEAGSAAS